MSSEINTWEQSVENILDNVRIVDSEKDLEVLEKKLLGKNGILSKVSQSLRDQEGASKVEWGRAVAKMRLRCNEEIALAQMRCNQLKISTALRKTAEDATALPELPRRGEYHPLTIVTRQLNTIFSRFGFIPYDGFEAETDSYNFSFLNYAPHHAARDEQDTFYLWDPVQNSMSKELLLRTHTSPGQVRALQKWGAPLRIVIPGRVFRNETTDDSHDHTFHQFEGLYVDSDASVAVMKGVLFDALYALFGKKTQIRMRPNFFPFVEPGYEIDVRYERKPGEWKWLEILGCGMVHPEVLKAGGLDPHCVRGFAFGMGITRLCMVQYELGDVRRLAGARQFEVRRCGMTRV